MVELARGFGAERGRNLLRDSDRVRRGTQDNTVRAEPTITPKP